MKRKVLPQQKKFKDRKIRENICLHFLLVISVKISEEQKVKKK